MSQRLRTAISAVEPRQVLLTLSGRARVRVVGRAFGFLRCGPSVRAVWGGFDETFLVSHPSPLLHSRAATALSVVAFGLGGVSRARVAWAPVADLAPAKAPRPAKLRFRPLHVP